MLRKRVSRYTLAHFEYLRETYIEPMIQMTEAIWMATLRENLSAMKDEIRAPKSEPAGIAQVIPPCR